MVFDGLTDKKILKNGCDPSSANSSKRFSGSSNYVGIK